MAFKIKKLNHTPAWYREHCNGEDGGSPGFRAMLTQDMKFIDADNDSNLGYEEKIGPYEEKWNAILSDWKSEDPNGVLATEMAAVIERESLKGFRPSEQFEDEPFKTINKLMSEYGLNENAMRAFLGWRSRDGNAAEIEMAPVVEPAGKKETREKIRQARNRNPFFE